MTQPTRWRYRTWAGREATVVAATVEFGPAHVVWRDTEGAIVLAEANQDVNELAQVGTLGSATRGVRPSVSRLREAATEFDHIVEEEEQE